MAVVENTVQSGRLAAQSEAMQNRAGVFAAFAAFAWWGLTPVYWKQLEHVPAFEILCHRIGWSFVFVGVAVSVLGRWGELKQAVRSKKTTLAMTASGLVIGLNWFVFIWAINSGHVLQASLGYYINPLVNVLLGFVFFRDRPRPMQWLSIGLAAAGVLAMLVRLGTLPWVSLVLAFSFGIYGLLRKKAAVGSVPGLMFETMLLFPPVVGYLVWLSLQGQGALLRVDMLTDVYLVGAGFVTSAPLVGFAFAAKRIKMTTLGLLQYIAPTIAFLLGVFVYAEPFTSVHLVTFGCIWTAVAVYSIEGWMQYRKLSI